MERHWIFILLALLAGAFVPVQTGANALLSKNLNNGMLSTLIVFVVAGFVSLIILLIQRPEVPSVDNLKQIPVYAWFTGGMLGALYVFLLIYLAPKLGMAKVVGFVIAGQLLMAMVFDHFGIMGAAIHSFNFKKLLGCCIMILGLYFLKN